MKFSESSKKSRFRGFFETPPPPTWGGLNFLVFAKTCLHMCFQTYAIEKKYIKKFLGCILNISDILCFSIIIGYTWLYWIIMEKRRISEIFQIHPQNFFLDFFSIAYVWKHICRQVLAKTKKFYPPHVGGGGGLENPRKRLFFELSENFTAKRYVEIFFWLRIWIQHHQIR